VSDTRPPPNSQPEHISECALDQLAERPSLPPSASGFALDTAGVPDFLLLRIPSVYKKHFRAEVHCPYCGDVVEAGALLLLFSTGLGPTLVECVNCRRPLLSHRRDWTDMTTARRLWFVASAIANVLIAAVVGGVLGLVVFRVDHVVEAGGWAWGVASVWAFVVAACTFVRLHRSRRRTAALVRQPYRLSMWAFECGLRWKVLMLLLLITAALGVLVHFLNHF
jgi:hypothetical protein